jgi:hypothetical protein
VDDVLLYAHYFQGFKFAEILLDLGLVFQSEQGYQLLEVDKTLVLVRIPTIEKDEAAAAGPRE